MDKVIEIDQSPIGRTPRSNPATYTGVFDGYSRIFLQRQIKLKCADTPPAAFLSMSKAGDAKPVKATGSSKLKCIFYQTFSFPAKCAKVKDIIGKLWKSSTKDKSIHDVLEMTVEEGLAVL